MTVLGGRKVAFALVFFFLFVFPFFLMQNHGKEASKASSLNYTAPGDSPPTASFTYAPDIPAPDEIIIFNASSSYDPDGWIVQYTWNFGEGNVTTVTSPIITHSYPIDGYYTVELTVTDNSGSTGVASAVIQVSTVAFFRVVFFGTLIPVSNVKVTAYYYSGSTWVKAPAGQKGLEIKYDNMTQPNLARTAAQKYRNPGYTALILRHGASNIGFDLHPSKWTVYFKFEWGQNVAYWPNDTTRVYTYNEDKNAAEAHDYLPGHQAYWDPTAQTYVIKVGDIPGHCVCPCECHPIIVGITCPPPTQKYYLTVRTDPSGTTTIPGQGWYIKNTNVTLTAPQTVNVTTTTRYRFSYWDIDGASQGGGLNSITIMMNANHTATAHYIMQYYLTVSSTYDSPSPSSGWFDAGSSITESVTSPVAGGSGTQYACTGWIGTGSVPSSGTGTTTSFTINAASSITWNWKAQYQVTFAQSGVGSDFSGTVVTVDGVNYGKSGLSVSFWYDSGSSHTFVFQSPLMVTANSKQYVWTSTSGLSTLQSGSITVSASGSVTGNYKTQYYLTVSSPFGSSTPVSGWFDAGASITASVTSPVGGGAGMQCVCTGWTGTGSVPASGSAATTSFTINAASSITWNWKAQYQVTFAQSGVGSDFSGTVVTVDGVNYGKSGLSVSFWYDSGSSHTFVFQSPLVVNATMKYAWSSTSGLTALQSGTLTITTSGNVIGNYVIQNRVTFDQTGVNSDFTGTVVTVDGVNYTKSQLPVSFPWTLSSTHTFVFWSPLPIAANSKQYVWTSTSGLSTLQSGSITITTYGSIIGNYKTQYCLTVSSPYGTPGGQGWYDSGATAYATVSPLTVSGPSGTQYMFTNWSGDASGTTSPSNPIIMNSPKTATANWKTQYYLAVYSPYGSPTVSGWFDAGASITASVTSPVGGGAGMQCVCTGWTGTGSVPASGSAATTTFTINSPSTITWNWKTQYYLTVYSSYGSPTVSGWFDAGSSITASVTSPTPGLTGTQYVCIGWTGSGSAPASGTGSTVTFTITQSSDITWNWKTQYYLTLVTNPSGVNSPSGAGWYDTGTNATISAPAFLDIVPGSSRYRFNGWTTTDVNEIADPTRSPTTVFMDKAKTVTANYVVQYQVIFNQSGVGSDFSGAVATIDSASYYVTSPPTLPVSLWWDNDSVHTFAFQSPLLLAPFKQYVWTSTTGLSTLLSDSITVSAPGSVTGNYKTQYYLAVSSAYGSPTLLSGWFDSGASITASVTSPSAGTSGTRYICTGWTGTGNVPSSGTGTTTAFTINAASSITWNWKTQYYLAVGTDPSGIATVSGEGWYDASTSVPLSAPSISSYTFQSWGIDGTSQGAGVSSITVSMNAPHTATAHYKPISQAVPVGGRTVSLMKPATASQIAAYTILQALFSAVLIFKKRKRK